MTTLGKELLLVAEAVSNEKGVDKTVVLEAIKAALESATRKRYGADWLVRVDLDAKTGNYDTYRYWNVVADEDFIDPNFEIKLSEAQKKKPNIQAGDTVDEPLASVEFGRIAAQTAKQVIVQKVREAERQLIVREFERKKGELVNGIVKKTTREFLLLDLGGNAEALLSRSEMLPQDAFRPGDRVRTYLYDVKPQPRGPQLFVSRTHPNMLIELFKIEVPEVGEQVIEIKSAARDPGSRAKIAVKTNDGRIDPIGACVGMRGARVQAVSGELGGERIDIVLWDDNPAQLVINAMAPAEIASIVMDEDTHTMDIAVKEEQLSLAIGRNGQNIKLASELTGWTLNIMTEDEFANKNKQESETLVQLFMSKLDVDEEVATLLVEGGFSSLEEIAYVPEEEMLSIEGFDEEVIKELRGRANDVLLTSALTNEEALEKSAPADALLELEGMDRQLAYQLASNGIRTIEDLADQSVDELVELTGIDATKAGALIMKAREPWFEVEQ